MSSAYIVKVYQKGQYGDTQITVGYRNSLEEVQELAKLVVISSFNDSFNEPP